MLIVLGRSWKVQWVLFHLLRIGLLLPSNLQETFWKRLMIGKGMRCWWLHGRYGWHGNPTGISSRCWCDMSELWCFCFFLVGLEFCEFFYPPVNKHSWLENPPFFNREYIFKVGLFSIAMLVYQRVFSSAPGLCQNLFEFVLFFACYSFHEKRREKQNGATKSIAKTPVKQCKCMLNLRDFPCLIVHCLSWYMIQWPLAEASYVRRKRSYYQWLLLGGHLHVLKVLGCFGGTVSAKSLVENGKPWGKMRPAFSPEIHQFMKRKCPGHPFKKNGSVMVCLKS